MPRLIQVIETAISRGKGTEQDRCRSVTQYHTPEGKFLAENDPLCEIIRSEAPAIRTITKIREILKGKLIYQEDSMIGKIIKIMEEHDNEVS